MGLLMLLFAQDLVVHELGVGLRASDVPPNVKRDPKETGTLYVARNDAWVPFELDVENRGPAVDGVVTVRELSRVGDRELTYRIRLNLAQGARKRVTFPVLSSGGGFSVTYEDADGGAVPLDGKTARAIAPPKSIPIQSPLVLVATTADFRVARYLPPGRDGRYSETRFVVPIEPAALPDHALEYGGVDLLVLDDLPIDGLSDAQQEAIVEYVARGGTLVVATKSKTASLAGSRIEPLLPGTPADIANVSSIDSLTAATGLGCELAEPVAVTTFALRPDAVSWGADGAIAHRRYERGTVIACGFPLSARFVERWDGSRMLMEGLTAGSRDPLIADPGVYQPTDLRKDLAEALKDSIVKPIPEFQDVMWIMIVYALAVALPPYFVFAKLRRLEWAWGAIVALAGAGALTVYGLGRQFALADNAVVRVGIVEGWSEPGPRMRHNFYTYYATSGGSRDVAFVSPAAAPFPFGGEIGLRGTRRVESMTIAYDGARLRDLETFTQDSVLFEATDRAGELGAARRSWVVFDGKIRLGEPGEPPETPIEDFVRLEAASPDRAASRCIPAVLAEAARVSERRGRPILVTLHDGGRTLADESVAETGLDFAFTELGLWDEGRAKRRWSVRRVTPATEGTYYDESFYDEAGVEYVLRLDGLGDAHLEKTTISVSGGPVQLEAYNWAQGEWKGLRGGVYLSAGSEVHVTPQGVGIARLRAKSTDQYFMGRVIIEAEATVRQ